MPPETLQPSSNVQSSWKRAGIIGTILAIAFITLVVLYSRSSSKLATNLIEQTSPTKNSEPEKVSSTTEQINIPTWSTSTLGKASINYPSGWTAKENESSLFFSNVKVSPETSNESLASTARFNLELKRNDNPKELPIAQWFSVIILPVIDGPRANSSMIVGGVQAIRTEVSAVGGRHVLIFIPSGKDVYEISFPLTQTQFASTYTEMLASLRIAR